MPKQVKTIPSRSITPSRSACTATCTRCSWTGRRSLSMERGKLSSMSLPDYLQEASAFFEANRPKTEAKV
jgi:hypothetical protein